MAIKLLYNPDTGKLLGAQVVGIGGVDKTINVLATAMTAEMSVFDLEHLELAYAPPFGSAKDPVNVAGFVAANSIRGLTDMVRWDEIEHMNPDEIDIADYEDKEDEGILVVHHAGEVLHRLSDGTIPRIPAE